MNELAAEWISVDELSPWEDNPRINDHVVDKVAESIERYGFGAPLVARREGMSIIAGHTRLKAAKSLGLDVVPVRILDVDEKTAHALALADNKLGELATWSDGLDEILEGLRDDDFVVSFDWLDGDLPSLESDEEVYTGKIESPVYEPQSDPSIDELIVRSRTDELLEEIDASDVDDEVKAFLRSAAERHTKFNFDKIADYYANASPEVQRMMEKSALVIIDFDQAIELGFVKMSKAFADQWGFEHAG